MSSIAQAQWWNYRAGGEAQPTPAARGGCAVPREAAIGHPAHPSDLGELPGNHPASLGAHPVTRTLIAGPGMEREGGKWLGKGRSRLVGTLTWTLQEDGSRQLLWIGIKAVGPSLHCSPHPPLPTLPTD